MNLNTEKILKLLSQSRIGADPRLDKMFLMSSPEPIALIFIAYLLFVLWLGPKYMKNRQPYNLRWVLIPYNMLQVVLCMYILNMIRLVTKKYPITWLFSLGCKFDPEKHEDLLLMFFDCGWCYVMTKIIDLLDTVFFVLRKKQQQITFLHVYHHAGMAIATWMAIKYIAVEEFAFLGTMNVVVHLFMYTYYCLAAFGPQMQKYLWWKKYITKIQLTQFFMGLTYLVVSFAFGCKRSHAFNLTTGSWIVVFANGLLITYLFLDFYWKAYSKNEKKKKALKKDVNENSFITDEKANKKFN